MSQQTYRVQRAARRFEVDGTATWQAGRRTCAAQLRNVSTHGALIARPTALLAVGQRLELTLDLGAGALPRVHGVVVRLSSGAAAFVFDQASEAFLQALSDQLRIH